MFKITLSLIFVCYSLSCFYSVDFLAILRVGSRKALKKSKEVGYVKKLANETSKYTKSKI